MQISLSLILLCAVLSATANAVLMLWKRGYSLEDIVSMEGFDEGKVVGMVNIQIAFRDGYR